MIKKDDSGDNQVILPDETVTLDSSSVYSGFVGTRLKSMEPLSQVAVITISRDDQDVSLSYPPSEFIVYPAQLPPQENQDLPGSWGLWKYLGLTSVGLSGFLESVLVGSGVFLALQELVSSMAPYLLPDVLVIVLGIYLVALIFNFLMHLGTGVQRGEGRPSINIWNDGFWATAKAAWGATKTAGRGQVVGVMAIVAGVLLQAPGVAVMGILWWATRHAYRNYTIDLPHRHARQIANGVEMVAYPTNSEGQWANRDPRASMTDFLKTIFLGSPAAPRLLPVERTVFASHVKNRDAAMAAKALFGTTDDSLLRTDPARWVAHEGLSLIEPNKSESDMARHMAFLNLVVQVHAIMGGPKALAVFEMPSPSQWVGDPAASLSVAAALIAYGADHRSLTFVAKNEGSSDEGWPSEEAMQQAALTAISQHAPHRTENIVQKFKEGRISTTLAGQNQINSQGQFLLAPIITHAFGADALKQQALVLGNRSNFDTQGTQYPIFFEIVLFTTKFMKNIQKQTLFLISA
ncbi:MAG: hypothetical protein IPN19_09430 [Elusimicrobia bacterium]|nr:hypothetical protein [Elusimicrobiota bacterium]